ncbi:MAG: hypothetical protein AAGF24_00690 [Cyanobacteria bacterium P01_H01_bin.121]
MKRLSKSLLAAVAVLGSASISVLWLNTHLQAAEATPTLQTVLARHQLAQAKIAQRQPRREADLEDDLNELQTMTAERFLAVVRAEATDVQVRDNQLRFQLEDQLLLAIADEASDRMRLVAIIQPVSELTAEQVQNVLIANFHTTLDARYAITDDHLVAVFVHPLASLQAEDLRSALYQVARTANSFGTTYSSGELRFAPGEGSQEADTGVEEI